MRTPTKIYRLHRKTRFCPEIPVSSLVWEFSWVQQPSTRAQCRILDSWLASAGNAKTVERTSKPCGCQPTFVVEWQHGVHSKLPTPGIFPTSSGRQRRNRSPVNAPRPPPRRTEKPKGNPISQFSAWRNHGRGKLIRWRLSAPLESIPVGITFREVPTIRNEKQGYLLQI